MIKRLVPFLISCAAGGFLCCCDDSASEDGLEWQPDSAEAALVPAFDAEEQVPDYARDWRMPKGFQGFPERWNARAAAYVTAQQEIQKESCLNALASITGECCGSTDGKMAVGRYRAAWQNFKTLHKRRSEGDYLEFRPGKDLPQNLQWQDGLDQPELGDPHAAKGGTIRLAVQRSFPSTFRPFGPNSNTSVRAYIYDDIDLQLTRIHPATAALIPGTADRWAISEDGRTVYFHIDSQATFSNGDRLTTRDFVTSLFVRTSEYSVEPFYSSYYLGNFSKIAIYGDDVLAVTLASPRFAAAFYAAIPASCTAFYSEFGPDYPTRYLWRVAPTTGGYTVAPKDVVLGRQLVMDRVRNWWAADRRYTRHSCNVDHIVYSFVAEKSKIRELFRVGELDVFSAMSADDWYEGLEMEPVHNGYVNRVYFSNEWPRNSHGIFLNCTSPPFDSRAVRIGFHYALNVNAVINTIYRGDASRLGSFFTGFGRFTNSSIFARPFSPKKARAYFAEAGYVHQGPDGILQKEDGTRLQVVVSSRIDPQHAGAMNILREEAARCGLDLRLEQMDDTVFYARVMDKKYTAAIVSWGFSPPLPNPSPFFLSEFAFRADGSPRPNTSNITATASPTLDAAIQDTTTAVTRADAMRAHHRVQKLIHQDASWVPGWTMSFNRFAQWRWLRWPDTPECRFCPPRYKNPLDSYLYWIDEDMRQETLRARARQELFPEKEIMIPLPSEK